MTRLLKNLIQKSNRSIVGVAVLGALAAAGSLAVAHAQTTEQDHAAHLQAHDSVNPSKLVLAVRDATKRFIDVNAATAANYQPFLGCISGTDKGAMGVHYVNGGYVGDGEIDVTKPEALIYEPSGDGMKLVGVEFIVDAATWNLHHSAPPVLQGQSFQLVTSPNRYGLAAFYELHVWAWRDNPNGAFVDWNSKVTCEGQ